MAEKENEMTLKDFNRIRALLYKECGIALGDEKIPLVVNRLSKRQRVLGISSRQEYLRIIEEEKDPEEFQHFIDAMSTNTTYFFREKEHFDLLRELLREDAARKRELRLWCAASSSGEEPYSLAMTASETLDPARNPVRMLATDICTKVLSYAMRGSYNEKQVEKVPSYLLQRYFKKEAVAGEKRFQVLPRLQNMILFKRLNLAQHPYPLRGPFDYIFCRNVMIYFDATVRQEVVSAFYKLLRPGGYLFIGHTESLLGLKHSFLTIKASVCRRKV